MLSLAGTMARFTGRAGDELYTAIRDALVERRMPLSFLATDAEEVSLDPHYVRYVLHADPWRRGLHPDGFVSSRVYA